MAGIQPWLLYPHSSSFSSPPLLQLSSPSSSRTTVLAAAARKNQKKSKSKTLDDSPEPTTIINRGRKKQQQQVPDGQDDDDEDEDDDTTIPEVVTNRMMRRVGVSVGAPLALGVGFFPFFYYLKVVAKVDVPTWIPFGVSFLFFGAALLGVSYGIVSASWDPTREGSLLGWNEARRNWPVFRDSLWGRPGHGRRRNN